MPSDRTSAAVVVAAAAVERSRSVGILCLLGIPGCSCSTGCRPGWCCTVAVAEVCTKLVKLVAAGCNFAGCSSAGSEVSVVDLTVGVDGRTTAAGGTLHRHNLRLHNLHLVNKITNN